MISRGVPKTKPVFLISLLSFFKSLALMLLPQQMMAGEFTLFTTDLEKTCSILLQTPKDLSFLKKYSLLCPFLHTVARRDTQLDLYYVLQVNTELFILLCNLNNFSHDGNSL
ncbi:hypothetical protein ILYODFUR_035276 [Ilyodon furcidens]|uniref:Secreted protein n=1 Tax=Ilyodon furcidens TaxID=33524 RepID=A0ABV0VAE7_9TELE